MLLLLPIIVLVNVALGCLIARYGPKSNVRMTLCCLAASFLFYLLVDWQMGTAWRALLDANYYVGFFFYQSLPWLGLFVFPMQLGGFWYRDWQMRRARH